MGRKKGGKNKKKEEAPVTAKGILGAADSNPVIRSAYGLFGRRALRKAMGNEALMKLDDYAAMAVTVVTDKAEEMSRTGTSILATTALDRKLWLTGEYAEELRKAAGFFEAASELNLVANFLILGVADCPRLKELSDMAASVVSLVRQADHAAND